MKSFGRELLDSFHRTKGMLWGVGGLVVSILAFYVTGETAVTVRWLIPTGLVLTLLIYCLLDLALHCHRHAKPPRPKISQGIGLRDGAGTCVLLQPHPDFSFGQFVCFHLMEGDFEILVGIGHVANIQENKLILVNVLSEIEGHQDLWTAVRGNNANTLSSLLIRPGAPKSFFDQLLSSAQS